MALKTTVEKLKRLLLEISHDLEKSGRGNRAASQRVRTHTIQFAKVAKLYRKESIAEGKKGKKKTTKRKAVKKKAAPKRKVAKKKAAPKRKATKRKTVKRTAVKRKKTVRRKRR